MKTIEKIKIIFHTAMVIVMASLFVSCEKLGLGGDEEDPWYFSRKRFQHLNNYMRVTKEDTSVIYQTFFFYEEGVELTLAK